MKAGGVAGDVPRTFLRALRPASGAEEERVAAADLDSRVLFPRFEIRGVHRRARLEIRHVLHPRQIDDDAARHDAGLLVLDAVDRAARALRDLGPREAVVDLALERVVAERIDVRDRRAVIPDRVQVHRVAGVVEVICWPSGRGLSGNCSLSSVCASDTETPSRTSFSAAFRLSGVIRFNVPI